MANLSVEVAGLRFANPVMPAAGPPVRDGKAILRCAQGGAGGLVSKTISSRAATPPTPNMAEIAHNLGMVNTELWSELPPEQWIDREYAIAREAGLPLIVSLGYNEDDIRGLAPRIRPFADAVELSTHYIGEDAAPMVAAIRAAKAALDVPVFVKLSPLGREMVRAAEQAEAAGADGIVAINSFGPVLAVDPDTGQPLLGGSDGYGWLSGPAIKPLALRCIRDIARAVRVPVIGVGGVSHGIDAVEMFMAGASAVQVCTAAILHGPAVFGKIAHELDMWLDEHGYATAAELRGTVGAMPDAWTRGKPVVLESPCNGCDVCVTSCVYDAIEVVDKLAVIDLEACARCGLCVTRCRRGAIEWVPDVPEIPVLPVA